MNIMNFLFNYIRESVYIMQGYLIWLYDYISGRESQRAKYRYQICCKCEFKKKGICSKCGCVIKAKVRVDYLLDENGISLDGCPEQKW